MNRSELPAARLASASRFKRLLAWLRHALPSKRSVVLYASILAVAVTSVYGCHRLVSWHDASVARDNYERWREQAEEMRERAARCTQNGSVRIEHIVRLQSVQRVYGPSEVMTGWRMYLQPPGSVQVSVDENFCMFRLMTDVPSGQSMWALKWHTMSSGRCECYAEYHVHSLNDPSVSTAELNLQ